MSGSSSQTSPYEYLYLAQSGDKKSSMNKAASVDQCQNYVKMMSPAAKEKHEAVLKQMSEHLMKSAGNLDDDGEPITAAPLRSYNPNRKLRRIRDNYDYTQKYDFDFQPFIYSFILQSNLIHNLFCFCFELKKKTNVCVNLRVNNIKWVT